METALQIVVGVGLLCMIPIVIWALRGPGPRKDEP
jgi:hypothetical protein